MLGMVLMGVPMGVLMGVVCMLCVALLTKVRTWQCLHCSVLGCGPIHTAAGKRAFPLSYTQENVHTYTVCSYMTQAPIASGCTKHPHVVWCMR